ncbi:MAG: hypothetical protein AB7K24_30980 [Gemmataceae bacterium]
MSEQQHHDNAVELPKPTNWPIVLALAVTLMFAGLVTNLVFSILGVGIFLLAAAGWFKQVFVPALGEYHQEKVPEADRPKAIVEKRGAVKHLRPGLPGHRLSVPEKIHPYSAGVKGGLVGGIAMTVPALIYGVLSSMGFFVNLGWESEPRTIWFPINALVSIFWPGDQTLTELNQFNALWLVLGLLIHLVMSVGLGLMYGVILPMLPGNALFWGGIVAPFLWTGMLFSGMRLLDPTLVKLVHWPAFITSQFVYGIAAGVVVMRSEMVHVKQLGEAVPSGFGGREQSAPEQAEPPASADSGNGGNPQ